MPGYAGVHMRLGALFLEQQEDQLQQQEQHQQQQQEQQEQEDQQQQQEQHQQQDEQHQQQEQGDHQESPLEQQQEQQQLTQEPLPPQALLSRLKEGLLYDIRLKDSWEWGFTFSQQQLSFTLATVPGLPIQLQINSAGLSSLWVMRSGSYMPVNAEHARQLVLPSAPVSSVADVYALLDSCSRLRFCHGVGDSEALRKRVELKGPVFYVKSSNVPRARVDETMCLCQEGVIRWTVRTETCALLVAGSGISSSDSAEAGVCNSCALFQRNNLSHMLPKLDALEAKLSNPSKPVLARGLSARALMIRVKGVRRAVRNAVAREKRLAEKYEKQKKVLSGDLVEDFKAIFQQCLDKQQGPPGTNKGDSKTVPKGGRRKKRSKGGLYF
jgi:flagellar motor protein MotB